MLGGSSQEGGWLLTISLILIAGCNGFAPGHSGSSPTPTLEPFSTVDSPVETTHCHCLPGGRFDLHHLYDGPVAVTVIETTDGANKVVADGRFSARYDVVDFDPTLRYGADYRIVIQVDGKLAWNESVSRSEGYEVVVARNGSMRVTSSKLM